MKPNRRFLSKAGYFSVLLFFLLIASDQFAGTSTRPAPTDAVTLDVIFRGPMTFMQYKDGKVFAFIPKVKGHTYVSARAINFCELKTGSYAPNWPVQSQSSLDPGDVIPHELKIDATQESVSLDNTKVYVSIDLGKPYEIIPIQFDPATVWKQSSPGTEKLYPTVMVARYILPSGGTSSNFALSPNCDIKLQSLGPERILEIVMGPQVEDNCLHKHAHEAFDALKGSINLDRSIDFPPVPGCSANRFRATDCRAPMIVVTGAS